MLEGVLEVGEDPGLVQELGGLQAADRGVQLLLGVLGNGLEQHQRDVLPDHRRRLQERLVPGRQPVDAGRQHGLHRGRDLDGRQGPHEAIGAALAGEGPGLDERPHALLQEERVALRPRDQPALERIEAGVGPEQGVEELLRVIVRQGVQPELRVVRATAPGVLILRPVVHEEQQPGGRQAFDEPIEQRLGLGVDPVEVFEDDQQRLHLALPQQELLQRVQGPPAALRRVERRPLQVLGRYVE
jgi:hypothetical protein